MEIFLWVLIIVCVLSFELFGWLLAIILGVLLHSEYYAEEPQNFTPIQSFKIEQVDERKPKDICEDIKGVWLPDLEECIR